MAENKGPVTLVKEFFSTAEKPVTNTELVRLGATGVRELAALIAAQS